MCLFCVQSKLFKAELMQSRTILLTQYSLDYGYDCINYITRLLTGVTGLGMPIMREQNHTYIEELVGE